MLNTLGNAAYGFTDPPPNKPLVRAHEQQRTQVAKTRDIQPLKLNDKIQQYSVDLSVRYIEDPELEMTVKDVIKLKDKQFKQNRKGPLNLGFSDAAIWTKTTLVYTGEQPESRFLIEVDSTLIDHVEFYLASGGTVLSRDYSGYNTAFTSRPIGYPSQLFPFTLQQGETVDLYLRMESINSMHIPIRIFSPIGLAQHISEVQTFHGIFIGGVVIMLAYNLLMFLADRNRAYFYYVFYILFYLVFVTTERVHGLQLFGGIPIFLHKKYLAIYIWCSWLGAFSMGRHFMNAPIYMPELDRVLRVAIHATLASIFISYFVHPAEAIQWAVIGTAVGTGFIAYFSYTAMSRDIPGAHPYFWAWAVNFTGVGIYTLTIMGELPFNTFTEHTPQLGIICHLILMSFALADRIKKAQQQVILANASAMGHLKRYQDLLDNVAEGIFQISLSGRFIAANPAMVSLLGYRSADDLLTHSDDAILTCFEDPRIQRKVKRSLECGDSIQGLEAQLRTRNGTLLWAESTIRVILDEEGRPAHYEGLIVDVTEKVEQEKSERDHKEDRLQRQIAENSAQAKSQFLANMSHEIRTPLTAIIGYGEALLDESSSRQNRTEASNTIVHSGYHLLELINDILDYSKVEAGKLELEPLPVSVPEIIADVLQKMAPTMHDNGLSFEVIYDTDLPEFIQTDPTRLRQMLLKICKYSAELTEKGTIQLRFGCSKEQQLFHCKVRDTGQGFTPEQLSSLIDHFTQVSPVVAREFGSIRLAMSLVNRLAEMLGGSLTINSTRYEGSTYSLDIATGPLIDTRWLSEDALPTVPELPKVTKPELDLEENVQFNGTILVAEDNAANQALMRLVLKRFGVTVDFAENGQVAVKKALRQHPDVILMDHHMPIMSGPEAINELRQRGYKGTIISFTASDAPDELAMLEQAGSNGILAKPIIHDELVCLLTQYLTPQNITT
ncbi:MAG: response regulator [Pseudomonadales bacterium]|nr:response regulator [Pseudomonadales bacterium]